MFPRAAAGQPELVRHGRERPRRPLRALGQSACAACRSLRRAARRHPGRGDRDARRRARSARSSPSPATRCSRRPNCERLGVPSRASSSWSALDVYVNETTRHADVILPAPDAARGRHYDLAFYQLSVRNVANFSPPRLRARGCAAEWEILLRLAGDRRRAGTRRRHRRLRRHRSLASLVQRERRRPGVTASAGREPAELLAALGRGAARSACSTSCCAAVPTATASAPTPDGLSLDVLEAEPARRRPRPARSRGSRRYCARRRARSSWRPSRSLADVDRLRSALARSAERRLVLVGRRHLRSNNSWMHNLPALVKGRDRCTIHVHPADADPARPGRRRPGAGTLARGRRRRPGRGHRRDHAGRGLDPARLGPRRRTACAWTSPRRTPASTAICSPTSAPSSRCRATRSSTASPSRSRPGAASPRQIGWSIDSPQLRRITLAVSDMRAIVEWAPQLGHSERSSKR